MSLQRLNNPAGARALEFGQTVSASLDALAEMDAYSFQATAGDVVRVRMSEPDSLEPQIELFDAQGQRLAITSSFGDTILDVRLENGGTFFLLLSDEGGEETGGYSVSLQKLNNSGETMGSVSVQGQFPSQSPHRPR
ncbi:MAG: hypothetical protein HY314_08235 [Acidobacteria bacterium]|nr:hypothetical protein [Acidobacteriota bacterium]